MSDEKKAKRKILPRPGKGQSFKAALEATNKQYAWTFKKLAEAEAEEKRKSSTRMSDLL